MLIGIDALFKKLLTFEFCRLFSLPRTNCLDTHHPIRNNWRLHRLAPDEIICVNVLPSSELTYLSLSQMTGSTSRSKHTTPTAWSVCGSVPKTSKLTLWTSPALKSSRSTCLITDLTGRRSPVFAAEVFPPGMPNTTSAEKKLIWNFALEKRPLKLHFLQEWKTLF